MCIPVECKLVADTASGAEFQHGITDIPSTGTTVQYELERAISNLTSESKRGALAGRTDARVHARGQVAAFVTNSLHSNSAFLTGLNHYLPEDISVKKVTTLPDNVDGRRKACSRLYCYTIQNGYTPSPLQRPISGIGKL